MKIDLRKIPNTEKEFENNFNSVRIQGIFCKVTPRLVKIDSKIIGNVEITCSRCGEEYEKKLDEKLIFFESDGIYEGKEDILVLESEDGFIDFDEICQSEIASLLSEYHLCKECEEKNEPINIDIIKEI